MTRPQQVEHTASYDNAMCESFFATLECELLDRHRFKTQAEVRMAVFAFVEGFYNLRRRHSSIGYLSPVEYERRHRESAIDPDARERAIVLAAVKNKPVLRLTINSTFADCFYAASFSFSRHLPKLWEMMRTDATAVVLSDLRRAISCFIRFASAER